MELPINQKFDLNRKTTWLYFKDGRAKESIIRAGICFPMRYDTGKGINTEGYAILSCKDLLTGKILVYSGMSWVTVSDILATEGDPVFPINAIKYKGIQNWLNRAWTDFYCQKFYYNQPEELTKRFKLEVSRNEMIKPKPSFIEVPLHDTDDILSVIWQTIKTENIAIDKDSQLAKDLMEIKDKEKDMRPSVYALGMCLIGYERFPWRKPWIKPEEEIFIR